MVNRSVCVSVCPRVSLEPLDRPSRTFVRRDCVAEGRLALILGMYQKEGLGRERATVERRRRQAVGGTNKLSCGASDSTVRRLNPAHHIH